MKGVKLSMFIVILFASLAVVSAFQTANTSSTPKTQLLTNPVASNSEGNIRFLSWEQVQDSAPHKPRKVFVDIYTPWCGPCKMYAQRMQDSTIAAYLKQKYYCIKFNAESPDSIRMGDKVYRNPGYVAGAMRNPQHELATALGIEMYPTTLIFDENLVLIQKIQGAQDKLTLDQILHYFGEDKYKSQKWEEFLTEYKSPFAVIGQ